MSRLHREACGRSGCEFVAGPSRDLNRVQRIADEHRATGHVLDVATIDAEDEAARPVDPGSARQYRARAQSRAERIVPHLASMRKFERTYEPRPAYDDNGPSAPREKAAREQRRADRAARLAEIVRSV